MKQSELQRLIEFTDSQLKQAEELQKQGNVHLEFQSFGMKFVIVNLQKLLLEMKNEQT